MIKPDIIVTQPNTGVDYPMWRWYMDLYKDQYSQLYVSITDQGEDKAMPRWISQNMDGALVVKNNDPIKHDWRDSAVNLALNISSSEWILFMEQDLLFNHTFWSEALTAAQAHDIVGIVEGSNRLHPAFLLVKRDLIEQTDKRFDARPPEYDHFDYLTEQLKEVADPYILKENYHHMAGLTHNYHIAKENPFAVYKPDEFATYNECLLSIPIKMYPPFIELLNEIDFYSLENEDVRRYFEGFFGLSS